MSRIANNPVDVPGGVDVTLDGRMLSVKGGKGTLNLTMHELVEIRLEDNALLLAATKLDRNSNAMVGTFRSLVNNMVVGVSDGFQKTLELQGVGYRAQIQGKKLILTLGFSHLIEYSIPDGIEVETPTQTQILVKGIDKQLVGQVSAEIRSFRPPEPYKGKGVRYIDEHVRRKEAKKK